MVLDPGEDDPYAIPIINTRWYVEEKGLRLPNKLPPDHFDCSFIYESHMKGECADLNLYR